MDNVFEVTKLVRGINTHFQSFLALYRYSISKAEMQKPSKLSSMQYWRCLAWFVLCV